MDSKNDFFIIESLGRSQNGRFELTKNQLGTKKEPSKKAPNFNGGVNDARFELFKKFIFDLFLPETEKICDSIEKLILIT